MRFGLTLLTSAALLFCSSAWAQEEAEESDPIAAPVVDLGDSLFQDTNGNGTLEVTAFGDSITRGVGDFTPAGGEVEALFFPAEGQEAGYPLRLETRLGLAILNRGDPGEIMSTDGVLRFARTIPSARPDVVIIAEGANDATFRISRGTYWRSLQSMINIAQASGVTPILTTIAVPCDNHRFGRPSVEEYNTEIARLAQINGLAMADFARAYRNTCDINHCGLYNLPDGLHPNTMGYDVMGEVVLATVLGVDLFAPEGRADLEAALGLIPGTVITLPDPAPAPAPAA